MAKMMFFKYYIELCKKINRRYKERKISDNSNTLEVNITRECIKEFLENPPELVKRCDKHILLGLLYLTAFPSKKKVIVHMAHPNGRVCGAKRPKCEAERSHHL